MEGADTNSFTPVSKRGFHCTDYHKNHHHTIHFCWHLLFWALKNLMKNVENGQILIYTTKKSMPFFTALIITKLKLEKQLFVKSSYAKLLKYSMQITWGLMLHHGEMYLVSKWGIYFMSHRMTKQWFAQALSDFLFVDYFCRLKRKLYNFNFFVVPFKCFCSLVTTVVLHL
jgi:hypothetical protein